MSEDNHLDLDLIKETDEYWYEDIDTTCPHCIDGKAKQECEKCLGEGDYECPDHKDDGVTCIDPLCEDGRVGCEECDGLGEVESDECCESCDGNGNFEILWNTAFLIPYLKSELEFEEARTIAWDRGWLLFRYDNELWIAAGSCGYDFTWVKAACALEICGDLPEYYASGLGGGGYVFIHNHEAKLAVIAAAKTSLGYKIQNAQRDIADFERLEKKFIFDDKMKLEATHATKVKES